MNVILFNKYKNTSTYHKDENSHYFTCPLDDIELYTGLSKELNLYLYCLLCPFVRWVGLNQYEYLEKYYPEIHL